jgi:hypothetical protein
VPADRPLLTAARCRVSCKTRSMKCPVRGATTGTPEDARISGRSECVAGRLRGPALDEVQASRAQGSALSLRVPEASVSRSSFGTLGSRPRQERTPPGPGTRSCRKAAACRGTQGPQPEVASGVVRPVRAIAAIGLVLLGCGAALIAWGGAAEPVRLSRQPGIDVPAVRRTLARIGCRGVRRGVAAHHALTRPREGRG